MKSKLKWVSGILGAVLALSLVFGAGVYASQWLYFTGDEQIQQSDNNVEEIMQILRDTHSGKLSAESALAELEELNPKGLAKLNKELREEIEQLKNDKAILSTDLNAKQKEIEEKNTAYDKLQKERDAIATARDNAIADRDNLQAQYNTLNNNYTRVQTELTQANEEIEHLRGELERANEAVANHAQNTNAAVEEARKYKK